jgi:hypothetical protein
MALTNFKFDGEFSQYQTLKHCQDENLRAQGKKFVLSSKTHRPSRPGRHASERKWESFLKADKEYDRDCEIALSIITSLLGPDPLSRVQFIIDDDLRSDRAKCVDIVAQLDIEYIPPTSVTSNVFKKIINDVATIDPLCSDREAAIYIESVMQIMTTNAALIRLHHRKSTISEEDMISKFYDKVAGHAIIQSYRTLQTFTAANLPTNQEYTFSRLCREIRAELITRGFVNLKKIPLTLAKNLNPVHAFSPDTAASIQGSVSAASSSPTWSKFKNAQSVMSESQDNYDTLQETPSRPGHRGCWNCYGPHKGDDCPSPHCRNCQKFFKSRNDPSYHLFLRCPKRPNTTNKRPFHDERLGYQSNAMNTYDHFSTFTPKKSNTAQEVESSSEDEFYHI